MKCTNVNNVVSSKTVFHAPHFSTWRKKSVARFCLKDTFVEVLLNKLLHALTFSYKARFN